MSLPIDVKNGVIQTQGIETKQLLCIPSLNVLLYRDNALDNHYNKLIFEAVQNIFPIVNVLRQNKDSLSPHPDVLIINFEHLQLGRGLWMISIGHR